eukprot:GILI01023578.1.p1 GENE.GILI01023578.1~~GILI01023578.1.p1  ORF type:complete len:328 (+),score=47.22 GILI01023578.1:55-984(+)
MTTPASLTELELANVNKLKATYPAKPLKAFWTALNLRKNTGPEIPMAIVLDTHYCGLERRSTKADGYMDGIRICLESGATPMIIAVQAFRLDVVQLLVSAGADVNATADETAYLRTPLHVSVASGYTDITKFLIACGADVGARDQLGRQPMHCAVYDNPLLSIPILITAGASVKAKDKQGYTLLHRIAREGDIKTLQLLLDEGCNVNARNNDGDTPFHFANTGRRPGNAKLLMDYGADIMGLAKDKGTPLHRAVGNLVDFVTQLVAEGASLTKVNAKGQTPLEVLMKDNHQDQSSTNFKQICKLLNPNK